MIILLNDILPSKTSQRKFSSVLEPYAVKVASTVLRGECHCEVMFLPDIKVLELKLSFSSLIYFILFMAFWQSRLFE